MTGRQALTVTAFVFAGLLLVAVEWAARRPASRVPTLGELCAVAMNWVIGRIPIGRIVVLGFWWWVGWHFFAR